MQNYNTANQISNKHRILELVFMFAIEVMLMLKMKFRADKPRTDKIPTIVTYAP